MKRCRGFLLCLALAGLPMLVASQGRPTVAVSFDLAVKRWQDHFGADKPAFEKQAAARIAKWLTNQVGFVSFDPVAASPFKLIFHLELTPGQSTRLYKETQLRIELTGAGTAAPLVWRFRPEERFAEPTGGEAAMLKELELRLEDINRQALVGQVLSQVPIAKEARLWKDPVSWVIPYRRSELCMDLNSVLRVVSLVPSGMGLQQRIYRSRAKGEFRPESSTLSPDWVGRLVAIPESSAPPEEAEPGLTALGKVNPQQVSIEAIYVLDYQRLQPCAGTASPTAVDFRGRVQ